MNDMYIKTIKANPTQLTAYASGTTINAIMYYSGGRYWYAASLPYNVIGSLVKTTSVKGKNEPISSEVVNRFLDKKHVNGLKMYIVSNNNNFTIPPVTLVSKEKLTFQPIDFGNNDFSSEEDLLKKVREVGSVLGKILIPLGYTFTALDGNHRCSAITELFSEHPEITKTQNILCNIVYETDVLRIRQDFVDINQNAKTTTATINTLFNSRDPLAKLTSRVIEEIDYLGECVELFSSSISKTSKKLYTLNNIKNSIIELSNYNSQNKDSNKGLSEKLSIDKEFESSLILELGIFYKLLQENSVVKEYLSAKSLEEKVKARMSGVITTGAGLVIASRVVSYACENAKEFTNEEIINKVLSFDWRRSNSFFKGKIVLESGNINSNINSINETTNLLFEKLFPEAAKRKNNKKLMK